MIDKSHTPRAGMEYSLERLDTLLECALEHASHGWTALEKEANVNRLNPDSWPPQVEAPVGSAQYHLANTIAYLVEVYSLVSKEKDHIDEVMEKVNATLGRKHV